MNTTTQEIAHPGRRLTVTAAGLLLALIAGCAAPGGGEPAPAAPAAPAPQVPPPPPPAPPPLVPVPFAEAVAKAGEKLFADASVVLGPEKRVLVVDPLVDASTGQQNEATAEMGQRLTSLVKGSHPYWLLQEFTRHSLATQPLLLIGTLTAINTKNDKEAVADAYRICLRVIDLRTNRVVAKGLTRATVETVNAEPLPVFRDAPTWHKDDTVNAYIKSCQGTPNVGDLIDATYIRQLPAAALINEAQVAFGEKRLADALKLYREASVMADPDDLRVLNGMYLTNWRLGKRREAGDVFKKIAARGIDHKQLPLKVLFTPAKATPLAVADLNQQYALWMREVATATGNKNACLNVVGHTSRTGSAAANETLSAQRAAYVKGRLEAGSTKLRGKVASEGVGSRDTLVNLGTDDLRDALDRRVEFRVVECGAAPAKG